MKTRLLSRSTRSLSLTESGTAYYERCKRILEDVRAAEGALGLLQSSLTGVLHVNGSIALGQLFLTPLLLEFQRTYPELTVELTLNDRYIDLVEEGVDVAVRLGRLADSNLVARRLGLTRRVLVATRDYLDRHGTPRAPADLERHNCLLYAYLSTGNEWVFRGPQVGPARAGARQLQGEQRTFDPRRDACRSRCSAGAGLAGARGDRRAAKWSR